jgi:hypothetical protein
MRTSFNRKEHTDSGLALVFLLLLIGLIWHITLLIKFALVCVLIIMVKPSVFYPFTIIWLNLSDRLGKTMSKILMALIFTFFVVPIAFFRNISGKDNLKLKQFRKSDKSVFNERNHLFTRDDMLNPY